MPPPHYFSPLFRFRFRLWLRLRLLAPITGHYLGRRDHRFTPVGRTTRQQARAGRPMGLLFLMSLAGTGSIYRCKHCDAHLAHVSDVVSKLFRCKHGKAYLFDKVVNVNVGETDDRMMTTGLHTVCDIFCVGCGSILGWKYVAAFEKSQRYKEGKFILERCKVSEPAPDGTQPWAEYDARVSESDDDVQNAM